MVTLTNGQVVKHSYRFYSNLSVSAPECGPDIAPAQAITGGSCSPAPTAGNFINDVLPKCGTNRIVYHNNMHWGLKYDNINNSITTTYTIQMYVKTNKWGPTSWVRIIDFLSDSETSDIGIYFKRYDDHHFCLDFWPNSIVGACPFFNDSEYYLLTFTRNGTSGVINVYVNNILFVSYNDSKGQYAAQTGRPIYIFRDKGYAYCESGEANFAYLSFSNQFSSQADVDAVYKDVCSIANRLPVADFSATPNSVCSAAQNLTVTYTGDKLVPETDYILDWNWDGGRVVSGQGMGPYVVNWPTGGVKNVTLTVKNTACGKPLIKTKQISIGNLALSVSAQKGTCSGNNDGSISVNATNGLSPYQYSIDSINYQATNTFSVVPRAYTVYVKDANNCVMSKSVTVDTENDITLKTIADTSLCQGQSIKLMTTSNATGFSWIPSTGLDSPASKDPLATPAGSNTYIVTATKGNCSKKDTVRVTVNPSVVLMPSSVPKSCGTFLLAANSNGFVQWSGPGVTGSRSTQDSLTVSVSSQATYKVRASGFADGRCSVEKELQLNFSPPASYRLTDKTKKVCGTSVSLNAAPSGVCDKLKWQFPDGTTVNQPTITAQRSGLYVIVAGSSSTGCESRDTVTVSLGLTPPAPTIQNKTLCAGESVPALTAVGTMIDWYRDSTLRIRVGTGATFQPPVSSGQDGLFVYYLTQTASNSCVSPAAKMQLEIRKSPTVNLATKRYSGCFSGGSTDIIILDAGTNPNMTYRWSTLSDSLVGTTQTVSIKKAGSYQLRLTNDQQCSHSDTVLVEEVCQPTLFAPTAFTPNGDNVNDVFELKGRLRAC